MVFRWLSAVILFLVKYFERIYFYRTDSVSVCEQRVMVLRAAGACTPRLTIFLEAPILNAAACSSYRWR